MISAEVNFRVALTGRGGRIASARLSMPHSPQPVGPGMLPAALGEPRRIHVLQPHAKLDAELGLDGFELLDRTPDCRPRAR